MLKRPFGEGGEKTARMGLFPPLHQKVSLTLNTLFNTSFIFTLSYSIPPSLYKVKIKEVLKRVFNVKETFW
jgi:hypothetical protein